MTGNTVRDLPEKLRVTAALLGCANQKDLCAAFRGVNPRTTFDLERSYKWMQGRALPRSGRVYEDWALLVRADAGHSAAWVAASPLAEFAARVAAWNGLGAEELLRRAGLQARSPGGAEGVPDGYLCGTYASYSHAQSPYYRGRLIRGTLLIRPAARRAQGLEAVYSQHIAMGRITTRGPVSLHERTLCLEMRVPGASHPPVFGVMVRPAPPASLLAGVLCSGVAVDPNGQPPYATRAVMVRVAAEAAAVEASNRYMEAGETVLGDLAALGFRAGAEAEMTELIEAVLGGREGDGAERGCDRVPVAACAALAAACDRAWMGLTGDVQEAV